MKLKILILFTVLLISFSACRPCNAEQIGKVNDFAGVLSDSTKKILIEKINQLEKTTTVELVILIVKSLEGKDIEQYSVEFAKKWRIGKKDKNNGILFIVALKEKISRIEVGYGLEHIITDADVKKILRETVNPLFKKGNFDSGFIAGIDAIVTKIKEKSL